MYYEEKFIDGKLMCRCTPKGEWIVKENGYAKVANDLYSLTPDERMEVFALFCIHCGDNNPSCQCRNDE